MAKPTLEQTEAIPLEVRALTNIAFVMGDATDTLLLDAHSRVSKLNLDLKQDLKRKWKEARAPLKTTRLRFRLFTQDMYEIDKAENLCDDSDFMADMILPLSDRIGMGNDSEEIKTRLRAAIFNFPSKGGFYDKLTNKKTG